MAAATTEAGHRWKVASAILAAAVVVVSILGPVLTYSLTPKAPSNDELTSLAKKDRDLLVATLKKLAEVAGLKFVSTGIQVFKSMQDLFAAVADIADIALQYQRLCVDQSSRNLFDVSTNVTAAYNSACMAFAVFMQDPLIQFVRYQVDFTSMIIALVNLLNAIMKDP
jgi:hypothetical protein